jgi:hypothetical protein
MFNQAKSGPEKSGPPGKLKKEKQIKPMLIF